MANRVKWIKVFHTIEHARYGYYYIYDTGISCFYLSDVEIPKSNLVIEGYKDDIMRRCWYGAI